MRHGDARLGREFDIVDAAAIWPSAGTLLQPPALEAPQPPKPATAVPDLPPAVGTMIVGLYAGLMAIFFVTLASDALATMMIVISSLYVAMFFAVPRIFLAIEADPAIRPTLREFDQRGLDTFTGHLSGRAALAQIFVVPVMLALPLLVIGITALVVLP